MARPRTKRTLEDQIQELEQKVEKYSACLERAKEELNGLRQRKKEEEVSELYDILKESGMSVEEVKALLQTKAEVA